MNKISNRSSNRPVSPTYLTVFLLAMFCTAFAPLMLRAQTAGEGTITGSVRDTTGAVVAGATITATNVATNVATSRTTSSAGDYTIAPLPPGVYNVTVSAKGFKTLTQENLAVDALIALAFNPVLTVGEATETVIVSAAPPVLDTSSAALGTVIENEAYTSLPLQMSGAQRDPTAFAILTPGTQTGGGRLPVVGGTGNYLQQLYLEGIPAETINQQGDNRVVALNVDVDAVDQFQIVTSTAPVEYAGAGAENFTMKSGGLKPHGQVSDFIRNTIFDAWSFVNKWQNLAGINPATGVSYPACSAASTTATINAQSVTYPSRFGCQPKPYEHSNELSASFGWKVPKTHDKLFFFAAYDKFHYRAYSAPVLSTIATPLMRTGDFTELNGNVGNGGFTGIAGDPSDGGLNKAIIYDPTSNSCNTSNVCTRTPFQGVKNGIPTYNVIPSSYISPIAQAMQSFLPTPSYPNVIQNNYLGTRVAGFDNFVVDYRVDYDLNSKNRLSAVGALGTENYLNNFASPYIPLPYEGGDLAKVFPKQFVVEDTYTITPNIVNQLKYGYTRFFQDIFDSTQNVSQWEAGTLGISNLPAGQAGQEFPGASFAGNSNLTADVPTTWTGNSNSVATQLTTPQTYSIVDNLQWLKGKHALTIGASVQFLNLNNANPATYTGVLDLTFNANSTANFTANSNLLSATSGFGYASFLLGAVGGTPSIGLQPVSEIGSRYKAFAPYAEDNWKVTEKLTLDLGLRWDYLPPFHEVQNHLSFLNPTLTNPATGTPGTNELAGNYGGSSVSCGCKTPVSTYWKNFGPRMGLAYSVNDKTVFRAGAGMVYSFGGGSGGGRTSDGGATGAGQTLGFNVTATGAPEQTSGVTAGPSFYLNNGPYFMGTNRANTSLFGPGFTYPTVPAFGPATQILNTGNYVNGSGALVTAGAINYADPYISGLAPEFTFYNAGFERTITKDMTLTVNYVGSESHHVFENTAAQNARGYWVNQLNPIYLAGLGAVADTTGKKPLLTATATSANVAIAQAAMPGISIPTFYVNAANAFPTNSTLTIGQGLVAFPQYSSVGDGWGENMQNFSYNSLQITLAQRETHGLQFNVNYTYSKNIGDDGTFRSGFPIPAAALSGGGKSWKADRIDRSWTTISQPEALNAFGVYKLPIGTPGHFGSGSLLTRELIGGWLLSGTYQYAAGLPIVTTWSGGCTNAAPNAGACEPDTNAPLYANARKNGSYGTGPNGTVAGNIGLAGGTAIQYIDPTVFKPNANISAFQPTPTSAGIPQYLIGNAPRTRAFNLIGPGSQTLNAALHRTFPIRDGVAFVFEADCINVWNKVTFASPSGAWGATLTNGVPTAYTATFGEITGISTSGSLAPRDWQFAGHINF